MATIDLGKVALVWKGTYAAGTTYESKDVVQFTDSGEVSSYIYVNASGASGQTPSTGGTVNTTYWNKMAGGTTLSFYGLHPIVIQLLLWHIVTPHPIVKTYPFPYS